MNHVIYTALNGARHALEHQAVITNNLANVSTHGFKAQLAATRFVPIESTVGHQTRTLAMASTPATDQRAGAMNYTSRSLDVAISEGGYLAVQLADGREAYTRNGNIQISADGELVIQHRPLMGDGGEIRVPPQVQLTIAADGTITGYIPTDPPTDLGKVGRIKRVKASEQQLVRGEEGLFHLAEPNAQPLAIDNSVKLLSGVLEGSNVNPAQAMVAMIANARTFEMQMKVIHSANDNAQRANQLLAIS
ncbi:MULTISPECIES: flagellar basal body rod protein FlgF [unclassified Arsenophonus]|uniref:flagellar basal body rod protein FlgF n=1 Tax=unclassified Arsenophonus TaxID=2627083 RepID=UPI0028568744|nr:flagellar basal body rod protein FlgF [Arsenophonus sp.]MDR5610747.1 flagellar basal body rod protein FlgF [Arsenophonus sp.]MDR5614506.1 flagellar basal body rod protein FlgF [Arsenophonus sp.]